MIGSRVPAIPPLRRPRSLAIIPLTSLGVVNLAFFIERVHLHQVCFAAGYIFRTTCKSRCARLSSSFIYSSVSDSDCSDSALGSSSSCGRAVAAGCLAAPGCYARVEDSAPVFYSASAFDFAANFGMRVVVVVSDSVVFSASADIVPVLAPLHQNCFSKSPLAWRCARRSSAVFGVASFRRNALSRASARRRAFV